MAQQNLLEIWQVEVGGQIYEAAFGELGDWIFEGSLQPEDRVRKSNLRWIEARRVPYLVPFFNAKAQGLPMPIVVTTTDADTQTSEATPHEPADLLPEIAILSHSGPATRYAVNAALPGGASMCSIHQQVPSIYLCDGCGSGFCTSCPNSYGGSVKICPSCGSMCRLAAEVNSSRDDDSFRAAAINEGFGLGDFSNALRLPFRFGTSLFFGALMFTLFSVGRSVIAFGGIYMAVSAIFCVMLANMLTFGVLANTVENFSQGRLDVNFMPSFDDFSLWDDVVHPFFLSVGAYLSSFGPFLIVLLIGFYLVTNSVNSQMSAMKSDLEKLPGTHYYDEKRTVKQSEAVKDVLGDISNNQRARIDAHEQAASGNINALTVPESQPDAADQLWEQAQENQKKQLEAVIGKSPETSAEESRATLQAFLNLAPPLVVIGGIFFLWGLFYFPAACAVAGYTKSFSATIDPTVGLDTIKRLGSSYATVLLMGVVLLLGFGLVSVALEIIFSAFDLPGFGNIPAKALDAVFTFYFSVVFSCILGYALFKASERLALPR